MYFSLSLMWFFPPAAHPAAPPATLMVFSHINQLIKSKFQWWINLPQPIRWSVACCYQSTCCQVIVSCWELHHYGVHLEAQLSYNGSNSSKSILGLGRLFFFRNLLCMLCSPRGEEQSLLIIPPDVLSRHFPSAKEVVWSMRFVDRIFGFVCLLARLFQISQNVVGGWSMS